MKKNKIISIIPARGGSKGLKGKNIITLYGKPLISWSIEASIASKYITDTVVSSDDDKTLDIASKYDVDIVKRPSSLSQDETPSEDVIEHVLKSINKSFEYLVLLQPTSPLRDTHDIDTAFKILLQSDADALISVYEPAHHPLKAFTHSEEGYLEGIVNNSFPFQRRQDLPKAYYPNGAIYIIKVDTFLRTKSLYCDKTLHYLMSEERSIDIDTQIDIEKAEAYLKKENSARD